MESRWGLYNLNTSRQFLESAQPPVAWVPGPFHWGKAGRVMALTIHSYLVPKLKKEWSYASTPLYACVVCSRVNFTVFFILKRFSDQIFVRGVSILTQLSQFF
jgi:hypothetical protein